MRFSLLAQGEPVKQKTFLDSPLLGAAAETTGVPTQGKFETIIGRGMSAVLSLVGIILLGYLLYAGFLWMTSGGETEQVKKAKLMIRNAIIGLVIIVLAYALTSFVLDQLITVSS